MARNATQGTFADHIAEFRRRLFWVAIVFVGCSAMAYNYHEALVHIIMAPLNGQKLVYLTPGGGFSFIFQISLYAGLIVAAPVIIHHVYAFIKPALPEQARRSAGKVIVAAIALIVMGICYGYFVAVPAALHFLSGFAGDTVTPTLTADSYLSFFLSYIAGLALLSLLPLLLMFWHWVRPLTPKGLLKSERWVILLAFIVAAIITPTPDAANQTMIAAPVILLYQLGVVAVVISRAREKHAKRFAVTDPLAAITLSQDQLDELLSEPLTAQPLPLTAISSDYSYDIAKETVKGPAFVSDIPSLHQNSVRTVQQRPAMDIMPRTRTAAPPSQRQIYQQKTVPSAPYPQTPPNIDGVMRPAIAA